MSNPVRTTANAAADRFTELVEKARTLPHYRIPVHELEIIQTSLEISKTFALIDISERLDQPDTIRVPSEELERLVTDAHSLEEIKKANEFLEKELERAQDRCPGCDHFAHGHGSDGCTFVFGTKADPEGRYGATCPCDVAPEVTS